MYCVWWAFAQTRINNTPTNNAHTLRYLRMNHENAGGCVSPDRAEVWRDQDLQLLGSLAVQADPPVKVGNHQTMAAFDLCVALDDALQSCDGHGVVTYITYATPKPHHYTNIHTYANDEALNGSYVKHNDILLVQCIDQCSVGVAYTWLLTYSMWLNIIVVFDIVHMFWDCTILSIDEGGLWDVVLLTTVACNSNCGPWGGSCWWR